MITEITYKMYISLVEMMNSKDRMDRDLACTMIWSLCNSVYIDQIKLIRDGKVKILNRRLINISYNDDLRELECYFKSM